MIHEKTRALGMGGQHQVLQSTIPATASGRSTARERPMGPPQSCTTSPKRSTFKWSSRASTHRACSLGVYP